MELPYAKQTALAAFAEASIAHLSVKCVDDHIFIKFKAGQTDFWSPQLHLEINEVTDNSSKLFGVFGPSPTLWTFFMFLHFVMAGLFIILGIWAYSSAALNKPYGVQLGIMIFTIVLWLVLYVFGRVGRRKGRPQMQQLYTFMMKTLRL